MRSVFSCATLVIFCRLLSKFFLFLWIISRKNTMGLARQAYNALFRRSSTFLLTIVVGAVVFERVFDEGLDRVWERMNEGKLWKHVKPKYVQESGDDL